MIAIFTKFDALVQDAYADLIDDNDDYEEAMAKAPNRAEVEFNRIYPDLVYKTTYPPKGHVCLQSAQVMLKIRFLFSLFPFLRDASAECRLQ